MHTFTKPKSQVLLCAEKLYVKLFTKISFTKRSILAPLRKLQFILSVSRSVWVRRALSPCFHFFWLISGEGRRWTAVSLLLLNDQAQANGLDSTGNGILGRKKYHVSHLVAYLVCHFFLSGSVTSCICLSCIRPYYPFFLFLQSADGRCRLLIFGNLLYMPEAVIQNICGTRQKFISPPVIK